MGTNTVEAQQHLEKRYPDSSPSKSTICRWYAEFKRGRTDTNDAERSGRPLEALPPENIEMQKMLKWTELWHLRKTKHQFLTILLTPMHYVARKFLQEKILQQEIYHIESVLNLKLDEATEDHEKRKIRAKLGIWTPDLNSATTKTYRCASVICRTENFFLCAGALKADSKDVVKEDYITKYEKRPASKRNICLADFIACSKKPTTTNKDKLGADLRDL
ncbi:uncharacterized protein LOC117182963 [Belonocnema kinseyi]|uniref:uncharacterized protein LOC117182963 n=1 Tax=Belonocnema kinseyi TaxID=2817044 RepID=UPI00143DC56A|nr:uncharacterized protein LOC117182963 [Belonocnema kinseyi]